MSLGKISVPEHQIVTGSQSIATADFFSATYTVHTHLRIFQQLPHQMVAPLSDLFHLKSFLVEQHTF